MFLMPERIRQTRLYIAADRPIHWIELCYFLFPYNTAEFLQCYLGTFRWVQEIVVRAIEMYKGKAEPSKLVWKMQFSRTKTVWLTGIPIVVVVVLLLNVHGQQLRSCWDGQLT